MTHDYKRHGTTTLFAALNVLDRTVIGRNMQRHRHQEFIRFLNSIEAQVPAKNSIHAIVDNYATHKHPKVRQWLARHPRSTFHFTPTSASWLNAVEGFFAKLTKRRLKRGAFLSVVDLQAAINRFVAEHNVEPKPFTWTANPDKIIQAVRRGHQVLDFDPLVSGLRKRYPEALSSPKSCQNQSQRRARHRRRARYRPRAVSSAILSGRDHARRLPQSPAVSARRRPPRRRLLAGSPRTIPIRILKL